MEPVPHGSWETKALRSASMTSIEDHKYLHFENQELPYSNSFFWFGCNRNKRIAALYAFLLLLYF